MPGVRAAWLRLLVGVVAGLTAACGILELGGGEHRAVVVESAQSVGSGRWSVLAELLATDISGAAVIDLSFDAGEVRCEDGSALEPDRLVLGTEFRFEQRGAVAESEPPQVTGVDLAVACG